MCSKIAPPRLKPPTTTAAAVIKKEAKTTTTTATATVKIKPQPDRKIRSKTRKRKYLRLLLELSPENTPHSSPLMTTATATATATTTDHHHQLNLFPLHPENLMEDKLDTHDYNMAASFFPTTDGGAAATLTGLLSAAGTSISNSEEAEDTTLSPSSMNYEEGDLVRTAMRNKERDIAASEEKWVSYSEVVEKKEEEVSSSTAAIAVEERRCKLKGLSLKLDYNEIMNAWSDKGPLYIHTESPQTVPNLAGDDDFLSSSSAAVNGLWSVPEMSETRVLDENLESSSKTSIRKASVQRYKEKRQSRLFAKKIRYQVRKLNAEKRPRIKGRFVKRS